MDWAELVLEYIKALIWPVVVLGTVALFREQIAAKIKDLKEATTPVGTATFDVDAAKEKRDAERLADKAAEAQQGPISKEDVEHAPQDRGARESLERIAWFRALTSAISQLDDVPDFSEAEAITGQSPTAAVMLAYADLEDVARAAWTVEKMQPPRHESAGRMIRALVASNEIGADLAKVAENLTRLRNQIVHGSREDSDVSAVGALNYIEACRQVADVVTHRAQSKLRHPSRSSQLNEWLDWLQLGERDNKPDAAG